MIDDRDVTVVPAQPGWDAVRWTRVGGPDGEVVLVHEPILAWAIEVSRGVEFFYEALPIVAGPSLPRDDFRALRKPNGRYTFPDCSVDTAAALSITSGYEFTVEEILDLAREDAAKNP